MKVAVCLSGHVRSFKDTHLSLHENLLRPLVGLDGNYDVFIYTCNVNDMSSWCLKRPSESSTKPVLLTQQDIVEVKEAYCPKMMHVEDTDDPTGFDRLPMLRRIYGANELRKYYEKKNNIQYDVVVRARMDTFFLKCNHLVIDNVTENQVSVLKYGKSHGGIYDGFAIADPKTMDVYCDIYKHSQSYRKMMNDSHVKIEKVLLRYLLDRNINVNLVDIPTYVLRSWGEKFIFHDQDPKTYYSM